MNIKEMAPWWMKLGLKLCLARVPFGYATWRRFGVFVHGAMLEPAYACSVFEKHYSAVQPRDGFTCLELGPGDSVASAVVGAAYGSAKTYLVDTGRYAADDPKRYREMAAFLQSKGLKPPDLASAGSIDDVLSRCSAVYLVDGLNSLRSIPDDSIDFLFSQAVLEHVKKAEFLELTKQLRRIMKDNGGSSHQIDLKDHLGRALNNLRFSHKTWESDLFSRSGFYTNRIRYQAMLGLFREAGFDAEVQKATRWDQVPTPRNRMSPEYASLPDDDLCVASFFVVLRPR